jgi:uncharacterized protein (DUF2236 family)
VTAGLLPERLRRAYGLPWGRRQRALFTSARWSLPRLVPFLPATLRTVPQARPHGRRRRRASSMVAHGLEFYGSESRHDP